jgi:hypothetical protein
VIRSTPAAVEAAAVDFARVMNLSATDAYRIIAAALQDALPLLEWEDPPISKRQDELDGEYVVSLRAQRRAADLQAEHSQALARLVERSEELADLQAELTRRQLAEIGTVVNDYTLWRDALMIAATTARADGPIDDPDARTEYLETVARPIRESLRWAGNPPEKPAESNDGQ